MDPRTARKLVESIQDLARRSPELRLGVITDTSPLSVAIGGSDTPIIDVKAIAGVALAVDDVVCVARFAADLIILGKLGDGGGYTSPLVAEPATSFSVDYTSTSFGTAAGMPTITIPVDGDYLVEWGHGSFHTAANGETDMGISVDGAAVDAGLLALSTLATAGSSQASVSRKHLFEDLAAGTVLTAKFKTSGSTAKLRQPWMCASRIG